MWVVTDLFTQPLFKLEDTHTSAQPRIYPQILHKCRVYNSDLTDITSQVILKPIVPQTQKEQVEYSVAAERRRVRMVHDDIIKDLLSHGSVQQGRFDVHCHITPYSRPQ